MTRPAHDVGDDTVVLTATITVDGVTGTKTFTLTVKAAPDNSGGLGHVQDDAENAVITYAYGDSKDAVTQDIGLGDAGILHGSVITWTSGYEDVISISETATAGEYTGTVTQSADSDVVVTLTATATDPDDDTVFSTFTFDLTVKAIELTDAEKAIEDYENVYIGYADGDSESSVTKDLTFCGAVLNGSTVTWSSGNPAYVSHTGTVTQPAYGSGNVDVTITATIQNGSAKLTKRFTVTVVSKESSTAAEALALDLADLAIGYYGSDSESSVTTHVVLPTIGGWGSVIAWESSDESIITANGTVSAPLTPTPG